jgi:hypothetical protein
MSGKIERFNSVTGSITMTDDATTSPRIPFGPASGGIVVVDSETGGTAINWHTALTAEGTAVPVVVDGVALSTTVAAGNAYPVPDALFAAPFIVGVTDSDTITIRLSVKG